ncbi:hypothetical protein GCM10027596_01730 [Nocardioides korecus]
MKKLVAGLSVAGVTGLISLAGAVPAQAYPDTNPSGTKVSTAAAGPSSDSLPGTGGPQEGLLLGGASLLVVGAATIVVVRRRSA